MKLRKMERAGFEVSEIGFGSWAIGGTWGTVKDSDSLDALNAAIGKGVNFIDTADVYGDGKSEQLIAEILKDKNGKIIVATKAGRRLDPHTTEGYNRVNLVSFVERSLQNLKTDTIDLLQLHCPPTEVYYRPEVFGILEEMVAHGKIRHYGVSVEKVEEGMKAIQYPNVKSVQIIFNMFRQRPAEYFLEECHRKGVGVIVRVPLASGLLTGKMTPQSTFESDDHRSFNRNGEAFDKGETFSGVTFEKGLAAVEELKKIKPEGYTMSQFALKWILMFPQVSTVIAGAKNRSQVLDNVQASELPDLDTTVMNRVRRIYEEYIMADVHQRW
ncbi:MAG: aldo/keto reductase [Spirochaetota bacterium]